MDEKFKLENSTTTRVGYRNPPKHTRFKAGQSGNRKGRPAGTLNMATVLARALRDRVVVSEHGKKKTVTKLEAAVRQLADKAAMGDLKAIQLLAALVRVAEERIVQQPAPDDALDEVDQNVVLGILKRLEDADKGDPKDDDQASKG
jgi:Family of unknown function (DUF5681)